MKALGILLALVVGLVTPSFAVGPVVGANCRASWSAVTTHTDGSPIAGAVTYNLYVVTGTASSLPRATAPVMTGLTVTEARPCGGLPQGQYTGWVTAVTTLSGVTAESLPSAPFPFVLAGPGSPSGLTIQ